MDGGDPASYEALRGRDGFREVCESVLHALDEVFIPPSFQVVISIMRLPTTELFVAMEQLNFWHRPPVAHVKMFYPHNWADPGLLPTRTVSGPCPQPWSNLTVTCDGQVLPCDIDLGKHLVMGSLCNSTLPEILAGRAYQSLLDAHRIGQLPSVCRSCLFRERAIAETEDSAHVKL
jgi:radical SAM protein with 4Fe4S-binding SPASM domain